MRTFEYNLKMLDTFVDKHDHHPKHVYNVIIHNFFPVIEYHIYFLTE